MSDLSCRERTFVLELASDLEYHCWHYLNWLKHLLERLGRVSTLALWEDTFRDYDEELLVEILATGWEAVDEAQDVEQTLSEILGELFPVPVEGITPEEARVLLESTPPFRQIRQHYPALNVERQITTYEALHLFRDALAHLAEALIDRYGKQGELIAYDAMLEEWPRGPEPRTSVEEFLARRAARFRSAPEEADMHSAGLEVELVRASETEVVTRVVECEWARYYREHHPRVGYLLACALDNAAYRSFNNRLRLQRTSTLMEGGSACDFRVYAREEAPNPDSTERNS
jgi:L-2-amino-thiazoline-4-carboxylic acid hydrolase